MNRKGGLRGSRLWRTLFGRKRSDARPGDDRPPLDEIRRELAQYERLVGVSTRDWDLLIILIYVPQTDENLTLSRQLLDAVMTVNRMGHDANSSHRRGELLASAEHASRLLGTLHAEQVKVKLRRPDQPPPGQPRTRLLHWNILPPATGGDGFRSFYDRHLRGSGRSWGEALERLQPVWELNPNEWYRGVRLGHREYFVAVFEGVAIAESPDYGNALYYYLCSDSSWQDVFSREKREARRLGAERIIHSKHWELELSRLVHSTRKRGKR